MIRGIVMGLLFVASVRLGAQDFKRQYQSARQHFDNGLYALAFEGFKPLLVYDKNNPYHIYANYFYALAAYQLGYKTISRDVLSRIVRLYPEWPDQDEALLWLSKLFFDQGDFFQALRMVNLIKNPAQQAVARQVTRDQLRSLDDRETLRMLLEENRTNPAVAEMFVRNLMANVSPGDQVVIDSLIAVHKFEPAQFQMTSPAAGARKTKYVVSLLFPFLANSLLPTTQPKPNQSILHLYQGIKLAVDSLAGAGFPVELRAYDTERKLETLKVLLASAEMKNTDLIIGPLFPEEYPLVREFSIANRISMVNPVTNNSDYLGGNPLALLFQPTFETLGRKSAEWVATHVGNKNCLVYYGESVRDSVLAFNFIKKALQAGVRVRQVQEVRRETAFQIVATLATPTEYDEFKNPVQFTLKRDSIGSIFVATDDPLIYSKVVNSVQTRDDSIQVVGSENWISSDANVVSLENFERLGVVVWSPNFYESQAPGYLDFTHKFLRRHAVFPSSSARIGFECMMIFGRVLHQFGTGFQPDLQRAGITAKPFQESYELGPGQDNLQVPFIRLQEGIFTRAGKSIKP